MVGFTKSVVVMGGSSCAPSVSPVDTVVHFNLELDRLLLARDDANACDLLEALLPATDKLQVSITFLSMLL